MDPPSFPKMRCCRVWAGKVAPEITHQRGQKKYIIYGNDAKIKNSVKCYLGVP